MVRFHYTGPNRTVFTMAAVGEVGPGDEFDVPDEAAVAFAGHGHCECLEPEKLAVLIAALPDDRAAGIRPAPAPAADAASSAAGGAPAARPKVKTKSSDPAGSAT